MNDTAHPLVYLPVFLQTKKPLPTRTGLRAKHSRHQALPSIGLAVTLVLGSALPAHSQDLDSQFNPNVGGGSVESIALQTDGKIVIGGEFTSVGGISRNRIARLNADGSLDTTFNPNANDTVYTLTVQSDGRILVGGFFTSIGGQTRNRTARLFANGTVDPDFNPNAGTNSSVRTFSIQTDGKILLGGGFSTIGGQARNNIARLNFSTTLDSTFNPGANDTVFSIKAQADGKVLVGGLFTNIAGQSRSSFVRLNADGSLDTPFNPNVNGLVQTISVQSDGKILIGGQFTSVGGQTRNRIARLNADGTLDTTFNPSADSTIFALALQSDEKIVVGGGFGNIGGQARSRLARLNADGSLDTSFNPNVSSGVNAVAIQSDGGIVLGGYFTSVSGQSRNRLARFLAPTATRVIGLSGDLSFGSVQTGQTAARTLTIQNTGNLALNVTNISFPAGFSGNWSGGSIAASGSQNVTVTFAPTAAQSYSGNITVTSNATSGTNMIAVSGQGTNSGGGDDHGDNQGTATSINQNSTTSGSLGTAGDSDYFRIIVAQTGVLTVQTTGSTDTFGHLLNAVGNEIAFDDNGGGGGNFRIVRTLTPGTYFLRIRHSFGSGTGTYDLLSSLVPSSAPASLAPPSGVSARAIGKTSILVRWRRAPGHGSTVFYKIGTRGPRSPWQNRIVGFISFRHTRLKPNTRYSYRVAAFDRSTGNTSRTSRTVSARTMRARPK